VAGHSQFKNIMHRKGAQDAKRARAFAKMIREITVSAREGLPDMAFNPRLRSAVMAARAANMPRDTIERAIKKASGAGASAEAMLEAAIEAGADDVMSDAEGHEVIAGVDGFFALRDALEQKFGPPTHAKIEWRPNITVPLDEEKAAAVLKLLDVLEDDDDVQNVYANFEIADEIMQKLSL